MRENDARKALDEALAENERLGSALRTRNDEVVVLRRKLATVRRALRVLHREVDPALAEEEAERGIP